MPHKTLAALVRVRRLALDAATRDLAAALRNEAQAAHVVSCIEQDMQRERAAAEDLRGDDADVEAFGLWLRRARQDLAEAEAMRDQSEAETTRARAAVGAARAALTAAETALEARRAEQRAAAQRREQAAIDEIAQRRR